MPYRADDDDQPEQVEPIGALERAVSRPIPKLASAATNHASDEAKELESLASAMRPALPPPSPSDDALLSRSIERRSKLPRRNLPSAYSYPQSALAIRMLRALMASRGAPALLRGRIHDEDASDRDVPYRATAFWQKEPDGDRIYPFLRCDYGELEIESGSELSFARNELFAGQAWAMLDGPQPIGSMCTESHISNYKDCDGDLQKWQDGWRQLKVSEEILLKMGNTTGYAARVRSLVCLAVKTVYGDIVFCVESVRHDGFSEHMLLSSAVEHAKQATARRRSDQTAETTLQDPFEICCRSLLYAHVIDHQDFWTWRNETAGPVWRAVGTALVGQLLVVAKFVWDQIVKPVELANDLLARLMKTPQLIISVSLAVLVLIVGFGLLPDPTDISKHADERVRSRLELFVSQLFHAYVLACCFLVFTLWHGMCAEGDHLIPVLRCLAILASLGSSYSALAAFFSIARAGASPLGVTTRVPRYASVAMMAIAIVAVAGVFESAPNHDGYISAIGRCMVAGAAGLSLCLLVSRLDSRLVGVPGILVAGLYLDALAHTVGCLLFTVATTTEPTNPTLLVPLLMASGMRLALDVLLFTVVLWALQGRAFERYLSFLAELAPQVPRSVLRLPKPNKQPAKKH
jgi:hypothetical protein